MQMLPIQNFIEKISTWDPRKNPDVGSFKYIDLSSVDKDRKIIDQDQVSNVDPSEAPSRARQLVEVGDVLVATVRPNLNGVALVEDSEYSGATASTGYCVLRPNKELLEPKYLYYWVRTDQFVNKMVKLATGANYPAVSDKTVKNSLIPFPPLEEQKRIAAILDKADAIRFKRHQAIKLTDQLLRSVFLDMFGDPIFNPKDWEKIKLGELCNIVRGGSPRPIQEYLGGTIPWIKIGDATKGNDIYIDSTKEKIIESGLSKTRLMQPGALIFANCGVSLGFARILKIAGCIHDGWLALEIIDKRLNQIFLLKALNQITKYFQMTAPDGTQPNLNTTIMKNFEFILPPVELQEKFENIVHKVNSIRQRNSEAFRIADNAFNSTVQKAFRGELSKTTKAA